MKKFLLLNLIVTIFLSFSARAQSFSYELTGDPVVTTDWLMGGDAAVTGESIRLTRAVGNLSGYIHYGTPQILSGICAYFTVEFEYKMTTVPASVSADGLAFWFLQDPPTGFVLGGGIGMPAPMRGFGLVFDTYNNDAIANNPLISLRQFDFDTWDEADLSGVIGAELYNQNYVTDGTWHHARIVYMGGTVNVYLNHNATPSITGTLDIDGIEGYFGFSASTGGSYEVHEIRNVMINGVETPPAPTVEVLNIKVCEGADTFSLGVDEMMDEGILHWYTEPTGGTAISTPLIDPSIVSLDTFYVSQSTTFCALESERVRIIVEVRPLPVVSLSTTSNLICAGGSITLDAEVSTEMDDDFTFTWSPLTGIESPDLLTTLASPTVSTTYDITVNSGIPGCESTASQYINVIPSDVTLSNNDTIVCAGTSLSLNAIGHTALTYRWTPETYIENPMAANTAINATESGTITLTASHEGCPDVTRSFYLEVQPVPNVNLGDDITICQGDTAQLFAAVIPAYDRYSYLWTPGSKLTDSTITNPVFNGFSSETYVVTVSTPNGCETKDTMQVTVNNGYFLHTNVTDTVICGDYALQLDAWGASSYVWTPAIGLSDDSIANPVATYDGSITYQLVGTSELGCTDTQLVQIVQAPSAVVSMPDTMEIFPGERGEINVVTNASYYNWFPPEGLTNTLIANPVASPEVRTRYYLTATTEYGCSILDSIDVVVNMESMFDIPNAFVPGNSFENNNTFKIKGRGDMSLESFKIYNRWGNLVFETSDINEGWDGKLNGQAQPKGVYVYQVAVRLNSGRIITKNGNVTLLR